MSEEQPRIFLSYRREDRVAKNVVPFVSSAMEERFRVFYDLDSIPPGVRWDHFLTEQVNRCHAFLAVVGDKDRWLGIRQDQESRIMLPADFIRFELETALNRGIPVVPLLVDGAELPRPEDLPESLRDFCKHMAFDLQADSSREFKRRLQMLMDQLGQYSVGVVEEDSRAAPKESGPQSAAPLRGFGFARRTKPVALVLKDTTNLGTPDSAEFAAAAGGVPAPDRQKRAETKPKVLRMQCRHVFQGHHARVSGVALSSDETFAISCSFDGMLRTWDIDSGQCRNVMEGHEDNVNDVSLSDNNWLAASASDDGTIRIWEVSSAQCLGVLEGHLGGVMAVRFGNCETRQLLLSAGRDRTVRIWNLVDGRCLHVMRDHGAGVSALGIACDGLLALSGGVDKTLRLWDVTGASCIKVVNAHADKVNSVALAGNGRTAVSGSSDRKVRVWELPSGRCLHALDADSLGVEGVWISDDGRLVVSGGWDKVVRLWDVGSGRCLANLKGHEGWVWAVAGSRDGRIIVSGSYDHTVRVWLPEGEL